MSKGLYDQLRSKRTKEFETLDISEVERSVADLFYNKTPQEEYEMSEFFVNPLTETQASIVVSQDDSPFRKIVDGYLYYIYGPTTVITGAGGARHMYFQFLIQGMIEDDIASLIHVHIDEDVAYPLAAVKIKE
jgi:hypothetical protein